MAYKHFGTNWFKNLNGIMVLRNTYVNFFKRKLFSNILTNVGHKMIIIDSIFYLSVGSYIETNVTKEKCLCKNKVIAFQQF